MKNTTANANNGNTINLPAHTKYTKGFVNSFLKSIVASLIPSINMHTGVVILPSSDIASVTSVGSLLIAPVMYRGIAITNEKNAGL